jgi:hypothetical protein
MPDCFVFFQMLEKDWRHEARAFSFVFCPTFGLHAVFFKPWAKKGEAFLAFELFFEEHAVFGQ